MGFSSLTEFICVIAILAVILWRKASSKSLNLPPGPKGLPLIGVWNLPSEKPWLVYEQWSKQYGDMIYFESFGTSFLILNSIKRVRDLMEKRSNNYSDRPRAVMLLELMGWTFNPAFLPYGSWWRRHRRSMHEYFHTNTVDKYWPIQLRETRAFLRRLHETPEQLCRHIRHAFGALILEIAYGISIADNNDPFITLAEEAIVGVTVAGNPGAFFVDLIPALKYIPDWFPGSSFKRFGEHYKKVNTIMVNKPFDYVRSCLADGTAKPSMATSLLESLPDEDDPKRVEEETIARNVTGVSYTGSAMEIFFLAMAMFPEVQKRAQAELDIVVGPDRLPSFDDMYSLHYINAIARETMRWLLVLPLGVGHMVTDDDVYDGYHIPKGTIVLGNAWAILHDPEIYSDPHEFKPGRFMKDGKFNIDGILDPHEVAFGYGRRVCIGKHLSSNSLFITIASVLAVYDILPPLDEDGSPIPLKAEVSSGLFSRPVSLECMIKPRSVVAKELILSSESQEDR
ncbi:hypothetical protein AMATHDRAFT_6962 [Amanita thiersii Skay4041]|uniref:Cytochrome P450 n=1 Tax=Amanita thiersii Skay4041 TaxID=703135 RepID=A0A2A9N9I4_9AGAR|nr:hypothetical protein AMATHDRAFT_6962 [Amanita thiersii Skay4041]